MIQVTPAFTCPYGAKAGAPVAPAPCETNRKGTFVNNRKRIAFAAIATMGLVAPLGLTIESASADSDAGYLIGTVTDNAGHPVPGADVEIDRNGSNWVDAFTDRNGRYVAAFNRSTLTGGGVFTLNASANGFTTSADQPVTLPAYGQNAAGPNVSLVPAPYTEDLTGVLLTGAVTTPNGLAHYGDVEAFDPATGADIADAYIAPNGHYYFDDPDLAGKAIKLSFGREDSAFGSYNDVDGYAGTFYGGGTSKADSPVITVPAAGQPPLVINGSLTALATITGAVKLPAAGTNWEATATIYDQDGNAVGFSGTDAAGNFSADVPPGTYYVRADGDRFTEYTPAGSTTPQKADMFGFVAGYYGKGATSLATATKVVVTANSTRSVGTITLTNAYHATTKPFIKAKKGIKQGAKLSVDNGTWNHQADTSYSYAWKVGSKTISTKSTLKISKKIWKKALKNGSKAKKLTVTVTATDKFGELVDGSVKQKVLKTLAKEQKAAAKAVKKAQKAQHKVDNLTNQ